MHEKNQSEVARLREQIALEYQAASRVFHDFTPTAQHEFITKRQENIAACYEELKQFMSPQEAMILLTQVEAEVQETSSPLSGNTS